MKRCIFYFSAFFVFLATAFSEPSLSGFLENDLELKKLALEVKKSSLELQKTSIENGIDISLSTGTANFRFDNQNTSVSFNPSAKISVPQAANLSVSASSKIKITNGTNNSADTSFSFGVDLISGAALERKIALTKSERSLLEAKRKLQNRALEAEKEYYTKLKQLFQSASEISTAKNSLYEDTVTFEEVKAKGYSKNSTKYRQAELKVLSDAHDVETKIHDFEHDCAVFASECGTVFSSTQNKDPKNEKSAEKTSSTDFLPQKIPEVEAINILDFQKEFYTKIENAVYEHKIAEMTRAAAKDFSLSANGGYTFKNSNTSFSSNSSNSSGSDTIDAGLSATFKGISIETGIHVPHDGSAPTYSASATVKPNSFKTAKIKNQTNSYNKEEEIIAIKSAEKDYETDIVDKQTELNDIKWSKQTNAKTFDMYKNLSDDMEKLFAQGIVRETEYLDALANKELYKFKLLMNDIDLIIYNNSTKLLFCRDAEIQD
ncbi:MAG: hypothetical protein UIB61_05875 [Treponema sp.]|jgi:hypothetical protein|nr:hypothetical protein [Treponema sp.]